MLTSKQRANLRSRANDMETILQVGKEGLVPTLLKQIDDALTAREMIKIRVLNNQELSSRQIANIICSKIDCCTCYRDPHYTLQAQSSKGRL